MNAFLEKNIREKAQNRKKTNSVILCKLKDMYCNLVDIHVICPTQYVSHSHGEHLPKTTTSVKYTSELALSRTKIK